MNQEHGRTAIEAVVVCLEPLRCRLDISFMHGEGSLEEIGKIIMGGIGRQIEGLCKRIDRMICIGRATSCFHKGDKVKEIKD